MKFSHKSVAYCMFELERKNALVENSFLKILYKEQM